MTADADRALTLLVQSARVSPILRDAVADVESEVHRLRGGFVEVEGAETCLTHIDGVLLETGNGVCDMSDDNEECRGAPLYRLPPKEATDG